MINEELQQYVLQSKKAGNLKSILPESDRPREKALKHGFPTLTNAELLAVLIGSGSEREDVVSLCRRILNDNDNKLYQLARTSMSELCKYHGIGEVKSLVIQAAMELARRYNDEEAVTLADQILDSECAYKHLRSSLEHLDHEEIWILMLNRAKRVIAKLRISSGGTSSTVAEIKSIFKPAIEAQADCIILAHNHPSAQPHPSMHDNQLTERVKETGKVMDIHLVDHLIIYQGGYYSYADNGML